MLPAPPWWEHSHDLKSDPAPVMSGVPQGSVIGPLLFLVLIGDIDKDIAHAFLSSFADDTRLTGIVRNVRDASLLQSDLETVYQWADDNYSTFNHKKFEALMYGTDAQWAERPKYWKNVDNLGLNHPLILVQGSLEAYFEGD